MLALRSEDLETVILPVGHVNTVFVLPYAMHKVELARAIARLTPRDEQLPILGEFVNTTVAVAVGDIEITVGREGDIGGVVEGWASMEDGSVLLSVTCVSRLAPITNGHEELAIVSELHGHLGSPVYQIDAIVWTDAYAVGILDNILAPRVEKLAPSVEDHEGMVGSGEYMDVVLRINGYSADLTPTPAVGKLAPTLHQLIL